MVTGPGPRNGNKGSLIHFNIPLHIVFYKEESRWIAHCLEFDLLGDGHTKEKAVHCLAEAIAIQFESSLEHNDPQYSLLPRISSFETIENHPCIDFESTPEILG